MLENSLIYCMSIFPHGDCGVWRSFSSQCLCIYIHSALGVSILARYRSTLSPQCLVSSLDALYWERIECNFSRQPKATTASCIYGQIFWPPNSSQVPHVSWQKPSPHISWICPWNRDKLVVLRMCMRMWVKQRYTLVVYTALDSALIIFH